ncbi:hypothetical protein POL68_28755 [Stigmatella sp. ncwal1]|uniref:SH3 domain-containing protein n=1 Tax=Stigmatella ashevillensis TaxID=2995309 RepID=A0ABT5DJG5_9BACT|nr:hypothetical protein [Stigmatella ashevillena]MDC0712487.1 hypothetical protein [Stigmatella ashevillena]
MLISSGLMLVAVVAGASPSPPTASQREAQLDLDGDGKSERVVVEPAKPGTFRLRVGEVQVEGELPGVQGFTALDLDSGDKRQEVLVQGEGQGTPRWRLFRYVNGALQEVPLPPGAPSTSGNGILLSDVAMDGWVRRDKYLYDAKKPGFTEVPQELYFVAQTVTAPAPLQLLRAPGNPGAVAMARPGESLSLIAFKPEASAGSGGWYLADSGGVLGWLQASSLRGAPPAASPPASPGTPAAPEARPELYPVNAELRVTTSFPLRYTRQADAPIVARTRQESHLTLLATDGHWYLVRSETKLLGWANTDTLATSLSTLQEGRASARSIQLLLLQLRWLALESSPESPRQRGLPSTQGFVLDSSYASSDDTYHFCANGQVTLELYDATKYGKWTLEEDTLKMVFTRKTGRYGVGKVLNADDGQKNTVLNYERSENYDRKISDTDSLSWSEVVDDAKGRINYGLRSGAPTCL